jgi:predicted nucleic acid-binding protein
MARFYVDTCIWRDYLENRVDRFRPLGEWAFEFFKRLVKNSDLLIFSDVVREELLQNMTDLEVEDMLEIVPLKLRQYVQANNVDSSMAKRIATFHNIHFSDSLHLAIAIRTDSVLVTRDRHFGNVGFHHIKKPEDLF